MAKYANRRRLFRLLLQPRFQLKYSAYFMVIAVSSLISSTLVSVYLSMVLLSFSRERPQVTDVFQILYGFAMNNKALLLASFGFLAAFYFILAIVFTKNIAAPIRLLVNHINALKNGDYTHKTRLRKNDDLHPIMNSLNELSDELYQRYPHSQNKAS